MNIEKLKSAVERERIEWQRHALERMAERKITTDSIKKIILTGKVIEEYLEDRPLPSVLIFGEINNSPLHVVVAFDEECEWCFVITAYHPDLDHFERGYKTRRRQ